MPKKQNQIPGLFPQPLAGGRTVWHWKPSPRLRAAGWQNLKLGEDKRAAIVAAMARNDEVAEWERGQARIAAPKVDVRVVTWDDLERRYRAHPAFTTRKPSTQRNYKSLLGMLRRWALDGRLRLRDLDRDMVRDLRNALVKEDRPYRTYGILSMLGIILQFAEDEKLIGANPATKLKIPEPPARKRRIRIEHLEALTESAIALAMPHMHFAIVAGFFTMQREGDLLRSTSFNLRPLSDVAPASRRVLANADGRVIVLELLQEKTGAPVIIPLHPRVREMIEAAAAARATESVAGGHLITRAGKVGAVHQKRFQIDFRAVVNHAADAAEARGDHALAALLRGLHFHDLRRSGMCWLRDLNISVAHIAGVSGHSVKYTTKILDTYLPSDPYAAAEAIALAVTRQAERDAEDMAEEERG